MSVETSARWYCFPNAVPPLPPLQGNLPTTPVSVPVELQYSTWILVLWGALRGTVPQQAESDRIICFKKIIKKQANKQTSPKQTNKQTSHKKPNGKSQILCLSLSVWMTWHIPSAGRGKGSCGTLLTLQWSHPSTFGTGLPSCADSSHISSSSAPLMVVAGDRFGATLNPTQPQPGSHWGFHHWSSSVSLVKGPEG